MKEAKEWARLPSSQTGVNPPDEHSHHAETRERVESPCQDNVSIVGEGSQEGLRSPVDFFRESPVVGFHVGMNEAVVGCERVAERGLPTGR